MFNLSLPQTVLVSRVLACVHVQSVSILFKVKWECCLSVKQLESGLDVESLHLIWIQAVCLWHCGCEWQANFFFTIICILSECFNVNQIARLFACLHCLHVPVLFKVGENVISVTNRFNSYQVLNNFASHQNLSWLLVTLWLCLVSYLFLWI